MSHQGTTNPFIHRQAPAVFVLGLEGGAML